MGLSRMPMAHYRRVTAELAMQVVKNIRRATRRTKIQNFIYFVTLVTRGLVLHAVRSLNDEH